MDYIVELLYTSVFLDDQTTIRTIQIPLYSTSLGTAFGRVRVPFRIFLTIVVHGGIVAAVIVIEESFSPEGNCCFSRRGAPFLVQTPVCSAVVLTLVCIATCLQVGSPRWRTSILFAGSLTAVVSFPFRVLADEARARRLVTSTS